MLNALLVFIFLVPTSMVWAQDKKRAEDSEETSRYPILKDDADKIGLKSLVNSTHKSNYRFYNARQAVDIWSDNDVEYHVSVVDFIFQLRHHKSVLLSKREGIDPSKAKELIEIYHTSSIAEIPTDRKIKNWQRGLDGSVDIIEYADHEHYSFKEYWEPSEQKKAPGTTIAIFFNRLETIFELPKRYATFENELPMGRYTIGLVLMTKTVKFKAKGGSSLFR